MVTHICFDRQFTAESLLSVLDLLVALMSLIWQVKHLLYNTQPTMKKCLKQK